MSSEIAIRAEGISKRYRIGATQGVARYRSLREDLSGLATRHKEARSEQDFWALKDVSFEIAAGETVGIIGRNGAGKSTMLKILARITPPSSGRGVTTGRVGSLLEVGTGFHPELTGRENVQLSAAVMGMRRAEVTTRFDEIVEFSGLEKFLDTPVKRYSSGMYMRLAFSVAAHLEPEILLVDEVLAVGDADFQKKCLGKMGDLSESGRTVLFISHSMPAIIRLCPRVLLLEEGNLVIDGPGTEVVQRYIGQDGSQAERTWGDQGTAPGSEHVRLLSVRVLDQRGELAPKIDIREPVTVEVEYWNAADDRSLKPLTQLRFFDDSGTCLFITSDIYDTEWRELPRQRGVVRSVCRIPGNFFAEGGISITASVFTLEPTVAHTMEHDVVRFHVMDPTEGDGVRGNYTGDWPGVIRPLLPWESVEEPH